MNGLTVEQQARWAALRAAVAERWSELVAAVAEANKHAEPHVPAGTCFMVPKASQAAHDACDAWGGALRDVAAFAKPVAGVANGTHLELSEAWAQGGPAVPGPFVFFVHAWTELSDVMTHWGIGGPKLVQAEPLKLEGDYELPEWADEVNEAVREAPVSALGDVPLADAFVATSTAGTWGRGATAEEATANCVAQGRGGPKTDYALRRVYWRSAELREAARKYDAPRRDEGKPSWVRDDGAPYVEVDGQGALSRGAGTAVEELVQVGRLLGGRIVARKPKR